MCCLPPSTPASPRPDPGRPRLRPVPPAPEESSRMSHIVTISTDVRDPDAVAAACLRLGLPGPAHGTATLFEGQATGLLVRLPGWLYPVVCDTATGVVRYDNYNQAW